MLFPIRVGVPDGVGFLEVFVLNGGEELVHRMLLAPIPEVINDKRDNNRRNQPCNPIKPPALIDRRVILLRLEDSHCVGIDTHHPRYDSGATLGNALPLPPLGRAIGLLENDFTTEARRARRKTNWDSALQCLSFLFLRVPPWLRGEKNFIVALLRIFTGPVLCRRA